MKVLRRSGLATNLIGAIGAAVFGARLNVFALVYFALLMVTA